jgi:hypothetical protein
LPLPDIHEDEVKTLPPPKPAGEAKKRQSESDKPPGWWSRNPDIVPEWKFPEDKSMKDLFTHLSPAGKKNVLLFPKVKHHDPKITDPKPLCIKYQCQGRCRAGCALAHLRPGSMGSDVKAKTDKAFKHAYT